LKEARQPVVRLILRQRRISDSRDQQSGGQQRRRRIAADGRNTNDRATAERTRHEGRDEGGNEHGGLALWSHHGAPANVCRITNRVVSPDPILNNKLGKKTYRTQALFIPALIDPSALSIAAHAGIA
jgi:hypothetical protein